MPARPASEHRGALHPAEVGGFDSDQHERQAADRNARRDGTA